MIRKLLRCWFAHGGDGDGEEVQTLRFKKAESSAEKPKESDYDKLFKEKHTVVDGNVPPARRQGEAYFEIP